MASANAPQRRFNLVLMNTTVVLTWYFQRTKPRNDHLWLVTLPISLAFFNGIAFARTVSSNADGSQAIAVNQVFRFPWRIYAAIFSALGLFIAWALMRRYHEPYVAILPLIIIARGFAECRRQIVISESQIVYRPPIGSAQRIVWADVKSIELGQVVDFFPLVGRTFWPAAKFTLSNGLTVSIPLGMTGFEQVFDAIVNRWKSTRAHDVNQGKAV